ncbi:ABC transporter permease [Rouxiella badensis]|jgi:peptide/nickel transport system permease protein|uniref:Peptide ABC transporter permease n=1 Tax=Rouxiella badensis TaxID=1646377 RepID=A0A1X0WG43_9GAMM|nr:ABC transporter permease [Rouxiella badensis]MCC3705054.1 ABC transporter permease [Rouxiella badensis]MCC3721063.1 ABC transporter permease [Rouxiella badensis]MCC3730846.1 ABC transporter permease [Rouxiella badensis]MCC3735312.1 ABC transporter permease [Rouxiella badensis]MCC3742628.1 ABC transporter permease [Rouxiella badensis]
MSLILPGERRLASRPRFAFTLWLSLVVLLLIALWGVVPAIFAHQDPLVGNPLVALQPPSLAHWFGTDHLGRDIYSRTVFGTALTLKATLFSVAIALVVGASVGVIAGYIGGQTDHLFMRIIDVLMAIPNLLLAMAIVTVLGFGTLHIAIAVGLSSIATFARLSRGEVLRSKVNLFVEAARAGGVSHLTIIRRHILPHALAPVLSLAALEFGFALLSVSALSFLGFGAPPPQPEWGLLVSEGRNYIAAAWWYTTLPGLMIVFAVLATNRVAGFIQDRAEEQ